MIDLSTVPPVAQEDARRLQASIEQIQKTCEHKLDPVMTYDITYCSRVDGYGVGAQVIKEFRCAKCNLCKPIEGYSFTICRMCGGEMKVDHWEPFDGERVTIHKCVSCRHEYDTT